MQTEWHTVVGERVREGKGPQVLRMKRLFKGLYPWPHIIPRLKMSPKGISGGHWKGAEVASCRFKLKFLLDFMSSLRLKTQNLKNLVP